MHDRRCRVPKVDSAGPGLCRSQTHPLGTLHSASACTNLIESCPADLALCPTSGLPNSMTAAQLTTDIDVALQPDVVQARSAHTLHNPPVAINRLRS